MHSAGETKSRQQTSTGAAAKFKAGMTKAFGLDNQPAPRRASGTGPGAAKARAGLQQAFGPAPPTPRAPRGRGPGAAKARTALGKAFGNL